MLACKLCLIHISYCCISISSGYTMSNFGSGYFHRKIQRLDKSLLWWCHCVLRKSKAFITIFSRMSLMSNQSSPRRFDMLLREMGVIIGLAGVFFDYITVFRDRLYKCICIPNISFLFRMWTHCFVSYVLQYQIKNHFSLLMIIYLVSNLLV